MKHVKRGLAVLALALLVGASVWTAPAQAHVLEADNGISAILHIKPDDRPVANKPTAINLLFNDEKGGFSINDYKVTLSLLEGETTKLSQSLEPAFFGAAAEGETIATFPGAAVYTLRVAGVPKVNDALPFTLNFTVRVTGSQAVKKGDGSTTAILSGLSLLAVGMVAADRIRANGRYRSKSKKDS